MGLNRYTGCMCLLSVAYKVTSEFPFIVTANRDESYQRPTQPMHWWKDFPVLAGRDLEAGGTWMGLSRNGRFAAVTNIRSAYLGKRPLSRGELVSSFLVSQKNSEGWSREIGGKLSDYSGFNLLVFDGQTLLYINNYNNQITRLQPGLYALSNHLLDTPWPKVEHARTQLKSLLDSGCFTLDDLLQLLSSQQTYAPHLLPVDTGLSIEVEEILSSPFIISDTYGTRASTAVLISEKGEVSVAEQNFDHGHKTTYERFSFQPSQ